VLAGLLQRDPATRLRAEAADQLLAQAGGPVIGSGVSQPWDAVPPVAGARPPVAAKGGSRNGIRFGIALGLAAVVGLVGALLWATRSPANASSASGGRTHPATSTAASVSTSPTAASSTSTSASASQSATGGGSSGSSGSLLTPAGIEAFVRALPSLVGTTKVYQLTLYPDYADFEAPAKSVPDAYDDYTYESGQITSDTPGGDLDQGENSVDLTTIDWSVIPGLVQKSDQDLDVKDPTDHYVIVDPNWDFASGTSLRVYCANDYGGGYLLADLHGHILDTYPAGS
jgi:hypothetical protein